MIRPALPTESATKRPRVLFLSISFDPEPGAIRGLPLARWLRDHAGYDVEVLTAIPWYPHGRFYPGYRVRPVQCEEMHGIAVWRVPLVPSHDASAVRRFMTYTSFMLSALLLGARRVQRPDIIYYFDNLPTTGLAALAIARMTGARVVQHIADMWPEAVLQSGMLASPRLARAAERALAGWCEFLYRRHAAMTVLSPEFKRLLTQRGVPEDNIEVIYNWADEDRFFPAPPDRAFAKRLGIDGTINVLYGGNIGPLQSLETVVHAAASLKDLDHVRIVIAGGGSREQQVRGLAAEMGVSNIVFLGRLPLEQMNALNALADGLLVHLRDDPALRGTIPSKVQVALACGRPLLLGVHGDAAELVSRASAGIVFKPDDPDAMANAVRQLDSLGEQGRAELGRQGREFYEHEIGLAVGAARTERLFRRLQGAP